MDIQRELLGLLRARNEKIFLRSEVQAVADASELNQALSALVKSGYLQQVNDNIYAFSDKISGNDVADVANHPEHLASSYQSNVSNQGTSVSRYVRALASQHSVFYEPTFADRWASSVTRLADDDVKSDETDDLLVALRRAGKLSPKDMAKLVISHHREVRRV